MTTPVGATREDTDHSSRTTSQGRAPSARRAQTPHLGRAAAPSTHVRRDRGRAPVHSTAFVPDQLTDTP